MPERHQLHAQYEPYNSSSQAVAHLCSGLSLWGAVLESGMGWPGLPQSTSKAYGLRGAGGPHCPSVSLFLSPHTVMMTLGLKGDDGLTELGHEFCWSKRKINLI